MITKQALGSTLFGMADILRDKVEDYKAYILSLLFFKRLSDNYEWENENHIKEFVEKEGREPSAAERRVILQDKHDFNIPEGAFWSDVRNAPLDRKNSALNDAVNAIADKNRSLKGIIDAVRWNESAPNDSGGKRLSPTVLSSLVSYLNAVDLSNRNASVDILGDAYEYLIKRFADENKGGTTAGQFYTPQEVVDIIVRYLKPQRDMSVYDPTCGSGGFLINAAKYCKTHYGNPKAIRIFGQEDVWNTWAICNINMILHGLDAKIEKEDTLLSPKFLDEDTGLSVRQFDLAMANFPFSQEDWWKNGEVKQDKKGKSVTKKDGSPQKSYPDKAEFVDPYNRFQYGIPPFSNGDFAFLQHIVASIKPGGRGGVVCPQGVLFRGQPEKTEEEDGQNRKADDEYLIRRGFLQGPVNDDGEFTELYNIVDAVVVLPSNLFYGTTIPGAILFLNKAKPAERRNQVLMVYAAKEGWYQEESNMNTLLPHDMLRISTILESWGDLAVATDWINSQKSRLNDLIQEELDFKLLELEDYYRDDLEEKQKKLADAANNLERKVAAGKKPTASDTKALTTAQNAYDKLLAEKTGKVEAAHAQAVKERRAIDEVEQELLTMLPDPELRKRYFAVVDIEELAENEFNLNIPRYVDTFEPEEEIELEDAIGAFKDATNEEITIDKYLGEILTQVV